MSAFGDFFFKAEPATSATTTGVGTDSTSNTGQGQGADPAESAGNDSKADSGKASPPKDLDGFYALMQQSSKGEKGDATPATPIDLEAFSNNPEAIQQIAGKLDFTEGLSAEIKAGIENGDAKSIYAAMQSMAQSSYAASLRHALLLAGKGVSSQSASFDSRVRAQVQTALAQQATEAALPPDAHPATALVLKSTAEGLRKAVPSMTVPESVRAAEQFLREMTGSLDKKKVDSQKMDWDAWMAKGG
jgi:hypothetical protein